ncbi:6973_t:CDS:2 [Entrophospora sp. SA101]|nr:6973_t:CDS:2 [Entrophospora sp. SA101]
MGNKPHSLTPHIYILNEKANNFNKYVLCLYCRNALGHEVAYQNKLLNKKDRIKSHLKKCENFKVVVGELNINQILEEEIHPNSQKRAREEDIEDGDTITKTITTNEEIEAYFRTCERMIQEERAAIEDENISNFIFLPAEDVFDLVGETEHPANNKDAKWAIKDLFKPLDINLWLMKNYLLFIT